MKKYLAIALVMTASMTINARDQINVVGSSTVYPFTTTVAEQFGRQGKFKTPKIESTGTGGGIKLFCNGVGPQHADAVNASRPMKKSEFDTCAKNGVGEILEIKIGYDGLTIAENKKGPLSALTRKEVYLALAKTVPGPNGTMIPNPYRTWQDINPKLPAVKIEVLGPPPTSGTRDSFHELYMEPGCDLENKKACHAIREDGVYVEAGENDNLIAQKLNTNVNALGIFGYSFLEENKARLKGLRIEGVEPNLDTISDGSFPASRPLFVYIKKAHVGTIPGLHEFAEEYVSTRALGEDGYLPERGLVPLDAKELAAVRKNVVNLVNFKAK